MPQPLFFKSTMTILAVRKSAIREKKKIKSRRSTTPAEMAAKCVRKLNDEIAVMSGSGTQLRKKSRTNGEPAIAISDTATTETMKAITWFPVVADMQAPMAR